MSSVLSGQVKGSPQICPLLLFTSLRWKAGSLMVCVLCSCLTPPRTHLLSTVYISIHWIAQLVSLMLVLRIEIYPVDSGFQRLNYRGLVYRWIPVNLMLGVNPPMDWHPVQGELLGKK